MLIDCDRCQVRGPGCADCVITHLIGAPGPRALDLEAEVALGVLADSGMVPPLRMAAGHCA